MVEYPELTIDELLLDEDNPRLGAVKSQSEALEALIRLSEAHFRNLMLSIKSNGLDPGDSLYIIEADDDGDFTVLEGNRLLSALKVLSAPDLLDGTGVADATKKSLYAQLKDSIEQMLNRSAAFCFPAETTHTTGFSEGTLALPTVKASKGRVRADFVEKASLGLEAGCSTRFR